MFVKKLSFLLLLISLFISVGCSSEDQLDNKNNTPLPTASTIVIVSPVSPVNISQTPTPSPPTPTPEVPMPEDGKGTVVGILYDQTIDQPYVGHLIYLARVRELKDPEGNNAGYFAELDVTTDPFGQTDDAGRFVIENVEPGMYGLVVRLPSLQEILLEEAETANNISVEIKAGEISDLETVFINGPG